MKKYAHKSTPKDINLFFEYMLYGKEIKTKREKEEVEAGYFAMCLLLPKEIFTNIANVVGGLEEVYKEPEAVARFFLVEERLVRARAKDLMDREKEEQDVTLVNEDNKGNISKEKMKTKYSDKLTNIIKKQSQD